MYSYAWVISLFSEGRNFISLGQSKDMKSNFFFLDPYSFYILVSDYKILDFKILL
jgi:hypothetical protein